MVRSDLTNTPPVQSFKREDSDEMDKMDEEIDSNLCTGVAR